MSSPDRTTSAAQTWEKHADKVREALDSADYEDPWLADEGRAALSMLIAEIQGLIAWKAARIENEPTDEEFYGR